MKLTEMYTKEELKKGVRNPFYKYLCTEVTVGVKNEDYEMFAKMAEEKGVRVEFMIQRAITLFAEMVREHED